MGARGDWQPIETAPHDGTKVLVWARADDGTAWATFAVWHRDHWCSDDDGIVAPTHWIMLQPPKAA